MIRYGELFKRKNRQAWWVRVYDTDLKKYSIRSTGYKDLELARRQVERWEDEEDIRSERWSLEEALTWWIARQEGRGLSSEYIHGLTSQARRWRLCPSSAA